MTDLRNKSMLIVNKNTGSVLNKISFTTEETLIALAIYSQETQPPQIGDFLCSKQQSTWVVTTRAHLQTVMEMY